MVVKKGFHTGRKISKNFAIGGLIVCPSELYILAKQKKSVWGIDIGMLPASFVMNFSHTLLLVMIDKDNLYKTERIEKKVMPCTNTGILNLINKPSKPSMGVMPKKIWDETRINDLSEAIKRRLDAKDTIPIEWVNEFNNYIKRLYL